MMTFLFTVAEKPKGWAEAHPMLRGNLEMQRFSQPIHTGIVSAPNPVEAFSLVLEDLRGTFADHPAPLEVRFEPVNPRRSGGSPNDAPSAGLWQRHRPIDMDITWTDAD